MIAALLGTSLTVISQVDTLQGGTQEVSVAPVITLTASDLESDMESQDISGLLQASRDVYVSTAGYTFGAAQYRIRGFDSENTVVMINGVPVNDMITGRVFWSSWGGLNDVTRFPEVQSGIGASQHSFGGIGGSTHIDTRASAFRERSQISYSLTNRAYRNRLMFTSSTGIMPNGWSFTVSGSKRWAEEGYVEGTFYDAYAYFLSAEKKINDKHSIGFTGFGAPTRRGRPGVATQEAYDLSGNTYYNPYWGYQNGEKRNSRVSNYHQPMLILSHYFNPSKKTSLSHSLAYSFGRGGSTALEWYDAADPRPDYYRNFPSYYKDDPVLFAIYTDRWENDETFRQLDWDQFYFANRKNLYTVVNANGITGDKVTGNRSKYIVEDRRNDKSQFSYSGHIRHNLTDRITLSGGADLLWYKGDNFKVVEDLLGGDFWVDVDKFAERESINPNQAQSDIRTPNRVVKVGDRFGYDYTANINQYKVFAQIEMNLRKIDLYYALEGTSTQFWRTGNMQNGRFPDHSLGDSEKKDILNYGMKAGLDYKITGRHFLSGNAMLQTRAPFFQNAYISPRTRDHVMTGLKNETIFGGDLSYIFRGPFLKLRLTGYYAEFRDQMWSRSFYHEELNSFVNYNMSGVDKLHMGMEFGMEAKLLPTLNLTLAAGHGDFIYNSRPKVTIAQDNDAAVLVEERDVYFKGYKVADSPETALSLGMRYNSPKYWFVGFNVNYFDNLYMEANPDRRTDEALLGLVVDDPQWSGLLDQEKLDPGYTVDVFGGKSWRFGRYYLAVNLSISNLLDETNFITGGFEQYRYDPRDLERFPSKYFYMYGRNYFLNVRFSI